MKSDIKTISDRVTGIGEDEFSEKTESLIYLEFEKLDSLIATIGLNIKEKNEQIYQTNLSLEEEVNKRSHEVIDKNRQLEKEVQDRRKAEEEVKQISSSLETIVLERTKELENANELLNRNAKLAAAANEAKGKFLAVMSHEMRTPLNAIIGFSHMLSLDIEDDSTKETLTLILNASKVLLSLINDVLDYAKYESGKMSFQSEKFNLKEDIFEVTESFKLLTRNKGLDFEVHGLDQLNYIVIGDQTKIKQVMNNLLNNAMKFTLEGKIEVAFHISHLSGSILIDCHIKDTGIGMTDETRDKLFEPFTQGTQNISHQFGGTGLGLSITKEILEHYEGNVNFKSELNVGTTCRFSFKLPKVVDIEETISLNYSRILYVEDNIVNQKLMQQYFNKYHLPYDVAFDGKEAVEKFKSGQFDLIFMDLQMPILDGYAATEIIRSISTDVYIIAMTAYTDTEVKDRCKAIGFDDYMKKPIDFSHLTGILGLDSGKGNLSHVRQDTFIKKHAKKLSDEIEFDIDICEELINTFLSQLKESLVTIEGLRLTEDYDGITRVLHKMKGGAATVRLGKVYNLLLQAEIYSKEGELTNLFDVLDQVKGKRSIIRT
nr:ATP-binding protein [Acidaminobacter sp. JC074]